MRGERFKRDLRDTFFTQRVVHVLNELHEIVDIWTNIWIGRVWRDMGQMELAQYDNLVNIN